MELSLTALCLSFLTESDRRDGSGQKEGLLFELVLMVIIPRYIHGMRSLHDTLKWTGHFSIAAKAPKNSGRKRTGDARSFSMEAISNSCWRMVGSFSNTDSIAFWAHVHPLRETLIHNRNQP